MKSIPRYILPVIVVSQFCCTSLWFASNGVMVDLVGTFGLGEGAVGHLTSAVQFGFIAGTLIFAILTVADRFPPARVFFFSALSGATTNLAMLWMGNTMASLLFLRFVTGFFLAGIYPVGMKIAADYYGRGLGKSLGFLVGALVLGTAFPHGLIGLGGWFPWREVVVFTSGLAAFGGGLMRWLVPDGPLRKASLGVDFSAAFKVFRVPAFRAAAFGYFGHMWELYAFWAFVPFMLTAFAEAHAEIDLNVPSLAFLIIGVGGPACVIGGYLSQLWGPKRVAAAALLLSGLCCLASPFLFIAAPEAYVVFLLFWGMVVIADSPLFSTLVAQNARSESKGTALTIVNCIGFSITIFSIQLLTGLKEWIAPRWLFLPLTLGPLLGLAALLGRNGQERKGHTVSPAEGS